MNKPKLFISCDWGTSNFRLRLVEVENLTIIDEYKSEMGVKKCYSEYKKQNDKTQQEWFTEYLNEGISQISGSEGKMLVVVSGMATSSIGLKELEYGNMPFSKKGENLVVDSLDLGNGKTAMLVSGMKTDADVMRGEELQALGLVDKLPTEEGVLVLPGTHSKHIKYCSGEYYSFKTYLTGELFALISKESILSNSVKSSDWNTEVEKAFREGVEDAKGGFITSKLFPIRAKDLFGDRTAEESYYYLSGLLIGDEMRQLYSTKEIVVVASGLLNKLYQIASEISCTESNLYFIESEELDVALLKAQKHLIETYEKEICLERI